jgi:hypothetical protein
MAMSHHAEGSTPTPTRPQSWGRGQNTFIGLRDYQNIPLPRDWGRVREGGDAAGESAGFSQRTIQL